MRGYGRTCTHCPRQLEHLRNAQFDRNLPVLMGLLAIWNTNFLGGEKVAVLPYEQWLKRFPAYLQQLTMESNGKHVTRDGTPVAGPPDWVVPHRVLEGNRPTNTLLPERLRPGHITHTTPRGART